MKRGEEEKGKGRGNASSKRKNRQAVWLRKMVQGSKGERTKDGNAE